MFYEVIPGKAGAPDALTYRYDGELLAGTIVEAPLKRGVVAGVVSKKVIQPDFPCREITKILYTTPLPEHLIEAARFIAEYYATSLATVMAMMLPNGVLKKRRGRMKEDVGAGDVTGVSEKVIEAGEDKKGAEKTENQADFSKIRLNPAQKIALEGLERAVGATKLLFGVTGSGKTNIYLSEAVKALKMQKSVVLLVPEIALTGQLVQVFREVFGEKVTLIHSKQTEAERHLIFERLLSTSEPQIVIGPRSALFAPLAELGLIIIDEEHESSYYQENPPRYSAVRVASFIAQKLKISCILGSATPNFCDYYLAKKAGGLILLTEKAKTTAVKPEITIVDLKKRENFTKNRYFSDKLLAAIRENLAAKQQTLIFHNRRGSAPMTICEKCGNEIMCPNCFLPLTLHADTYDLACHTCGFTEKVPSVCPECKTPQLLHKGFGTKLLESELKRLFPAARIRRFDADNKKDEGFDATYEAVREGKIDILIGTQTLAKGLDLPKLATVGVVQADAGLSLPDFMSEERVFELLTQVIGRVGRGHTEKAEVFIQTFRPEHPVIKFATQEDYTGFTEYLTALRKKGGFPPFSFVAKVELTMKTERAVITKIRGVYRELSSKKGLVVSTPMPNFHERTAKGYTWQLIVRAKSRKSLVAALSRLGASYKITLDPPSLL